jgi:hypothetical protein
MPFRAPKPAGSTNWMQSWGVILRRDLESPGNNEQKNDVCRTSVIFALDNNRNDC